MLADGTADITLGGVLAGNEAGVHGGGVAALEGATVRLAPTARLHANAAQGSGGGAFLAGATSVIGAPPRPASPPPSHASAVGDGSTRR